MRFFPRPLPLSQLPPPHRFHPSRCHVCTPSRMAPDPARHAGVFHATSLLHSVLFKSRNFLKTGSIQSAHTSLTVHSEYFRFKRPFRNTSQASFYFMYILVKFETVN